MNDELVRVLQETRALLSDPTRWTKGAGARDAFGDRVPVRHPSACCWCITGALANIAGAPIMTLEWTAREALERAIGTARGRSIEDWNDVDHRTHGEVIDVFDRAIEAARHG